MPERPRKSTLSCLPNPTGWYRCLACALLLAGVVALLSARAQSIPEGTQPDGAQPRLAAAVAHAAVIFAGQVIGVDRFPQSDAIAVRFSVTAGIRGATPGLFQASFVENAPGSFPLRPGQRVVALLHARNPAGITSFVNGRCGLFERNGADRVDLRRLQLCPASPGPSLVALPDPVVFWPDPRNFLPETSPPPAFLPAKAGRGRTTPATDAAFGAIRAGVSPNTSVDTMDTAEFLRLVADMAGDGSRLPWHNHPGPPPFHAPSAASPPAALYAPPGVR